jgi:hypothetical protein
LFTKKGINDMTAGLPGTGIGGVFYLLSALFMPIIEIVMTLRGESSLARWFLVLRQLTIAASILGAMWLLGLAAGIVFDMFTVAQPVALGLARNMHTHIVQTAFRLNMFHIAPVIMSIATLTVILTLTNVMRLFFRPVNEKA